MITIRKSLLTCFVFTSLSSWAQTSSLELPNIFSCFSENNWKTVDSVKSTDGSALLAGVASYKNYAYAAGSALADVTGYAWMVRRSTDYGETWSTAKVMSGSGRGIAIDPRNGTVYSIGAVSNSNWVVKKSSDRGLNWTKIDELIDGDTYYSSSRITVDGLGNILVVGVAYGGDGPAPILRRSEDGGQTWQTIYFAASAFRASSIAASSDGQVVIAGGNAISNPETEASKWVVMYSKDGKSDWTQVDLFAGSTSDPLMGAFASGVSISKSGKVVVTGNVSKGMEGLSKIIVRESYLSNILNWSTALTYQPVYRGGLRGSAFSQHISWIRNQRYMINGAQRSPQSAITTNIALDKRLYLPLRVSDRITNNFQSPFQNESLYNGGLTTLSNGLVLSGYIEDDQNSKSWFIRKLTCEF